MPNIIPFLFESHPVRTIVIGEDLWFAAADVCTALNYAHTPHAMRILDADEKGVHEMDTNGGKQVVTIISEPGLYRLIHRSKKPEAKRFDRWLCHEVLPSIRKTGSYSQTDVPQCPPSIEALFGVVGKSRFMLSFDLTGRMHLAQVRDGEQVLDVTDPSDITRLMLYDLPEELLPHAAELAMMRVLESKGR